MLPPSGSRIKPSHAPLLARLRSPTAADAALRTAAGAHHWRIAYLEFGASYGRGNGEIVQIGDGSSAQNSLDKVPHHIVLSHLYIHGDPVWGQKRGIALNAAAVTIRDSHISDCKGVGQDTQAIGGWNGPGPYTIENNYLEAAGENVMFGGADPAIPNLVADGITFRGNLVSRPMAWRDPILRTPVITMASREAGGSLPDGTYAYRVVADGLARGTATPVVAIRSTASAESVVTASGGTSAIRIRWQAVSGATGYRVFGRASGGQTLSWAVTATEFLDTGAAGTTGAVPTVPGTVWNVKNLFELKSARNVLVENNILENHWKEGQPGFAIVLTPRNSNGACTWCVVENVRFQDIVRNMAAGIEILLGYDSRPTRQTNNISVRAQRLYQDEHQPWRPRQVHADRRRAARHHHRAQHDRCKRQWRDLCGRGQHHAGSDRGSWVQDDRQRRAPRIVWNPRCAFRLWRGHHCSLLSGRSDRGQLSGRSADVEIPDADNWSVASADTL